MEAPKIEIVPLEESAIEEAADLLAEAFLNEPGAMAVIKADPERRLRILRRHYATHVALNLPQGVSKTAITNGELAGVMLISAPGMATVTRLGMLKALWSALFHVSPGVIWRALRSSMDDENHRPRERNYYLETLGVKPRFQGRGVGGAMLAYLNRLADREGTLIYLSTTDPKTVSLYEKFGFRIESQTDIIGIRNYHMVRPPGEIGIRAQSPGLE